MLTGSAALEAAVECNPKLCGDVLDDQARLRANVVIFVDGRRRHDRIGLAEPLMATNVVHVLQALAGE